MVPGMMAGRFYVKKLCSKQCIDSEQLVENQWKINYPGWSLLRRGTDFEYIVWNLALENKTPNLSPVESGVCLFFLSLKIDEQNF